MDGCWEKRRRRRRRKGPGSLASSVCLKPQHTPTHAICNFFVPRTLLLIQPLNFIIVRGCEGLQNYALRALGYTGVWSVRGCGCGHRSDAACRDLRARDARPPNSFRLSKVAPLAHPPSPPLSLSLSLSLARSLSSLSLYVSSVAVCGFDA